MELLLLPGLAKERLIIRFQRKRWRDCLQTNLAQAANAENRQGRASASE
ncbi:hypothetical protein RRSWK_04709 [Rhodopirellula sp. SWK7]|nr:hypothetical protein RRSWK_04709 [Rhodopirellula sp. SWK7]